MNIHSSNIQKYGVEHIKDFCDSNTLKELVHQIIALAKTNQGIENKNFHWQDNILTSAHNLLNFLPQFKDFILSSKAPKIFQDVYNLEPIIHGNSSYFAKPALIGKEVHLHQDMAFFNLKSHEVLTFWIAIDPSTKENGAVYYIKNKKALNTKYPHEPRGNPGTSMRIIPSDSYNIIKDEIFCPNLVPGDCLIHNAYIPHGSYPNFSDSPRRAINFTLMSGHNSIDEKSHRKYLNELDLFLKAPN